MRRIVLFIGFCVVILSLPFIACELKTEEDTDQNANTVAMLTAQSGGYEFLEQDLQGNINGVTWQYQSGKAQISYYDDTQLSINIFSEAPDGDDPCGSGAFSFSSYYIIFSVANAVGVYELGFSQSVTLLDSSGDIPNNIIAMEGVVEIQSIDTNGNVTGRIDARYDSSSYVNGNFTIQYCNSK